MFYPNFNEEKKVKKLGYKRIAGIDEAGRGPLTGPVVAAGVKIDSSFKFKDLSLLGIKDSKKLSPKKREEFYKILTNHPAIEWRVAKVSPKVIDRINILEATKLAMKRVAEKLKADFLIIDGNFSLKTKIPQKSIIKADEKVLSCTMAGIIAKVTRDRIMLRYHKKYPQYAFDKHKGYPTKFHKTMIKKHGLSKICRETFKF